MTKPSPAEVSRFLSKLAPDPNSTCVLWTGGTTRSSTSLRTYGCVRLGRGPARRLVRAHRLAWSLFRGPLASDLEIDHICRQPLCVNPYHLRPLTKEEHARVSNLARWPLPTSEEFFAPPDPDSEVWDFGA